MAEECLESIFILKISCELLCLMVYPSGIYMPCEMVSVMIQWCWFYQANRCDEEEMYE